MLPPLMPEAWSDFDNFWKILFSPLGRAYACQKGFIFYVDIEIAISIYPSMLVRLPQSLVNV